MVNKAKMNKIDDAINDLGNDINDANELHDGPIIALPKDPAASQPMTTRQAGQARRSHNVR